MSRQEDACGNGCAFDLTCADYDYCRDARARFTEPEASGAPEPSRPQEELAALQRRYDGLRAVQQALLEELAGQCTRIGAPVHALVPSGLPACSCGVTLADAREDFIRHVLGAIMPEPE